MQTHTTSWRFAFYQVSYLLFNFVIIPNKVKLVVLERNFVIFGQAPIVNLYRVMVAAQSMLQIAADHILYHHMLQKSFCQNVVPIHT